MKYYAKIENKEAKIVSIGTGTNSAFYESIGMTLMDVEQSDIDGQWYQVGYAPMKSELEKQAEADAEALAHAKSERATAVASLTVEVDGMVFDGDEKAQERMTRAVTLADSPEETTEWVLHDNTVAIVTAKQLRKACKLAGKAQTVLWTKPYADTVTVNEIDTETNTHYTLE